MNTKITCRRINSVDYVQVDAYRNKYALKA